MHIWMNSTFAQQVSASLLANSGKNVSMRGLIEAVFGTFLPEDVARRSCKKPLS